MAPGTDGALAVVGRRRADGVRQRRAVALHRRAAPHRRRVARRVHRPDVRRRSWPARSCAAGRSPAAAAALRGVAVQRVRVNGTQFASAPIGGEQSNSSHVDRRSLGAQAAAPGDARAAPGGRAARPPQPGRLPQRARRWPARWSTRPRTAASGRRSPRWCRWSTAPATPTRSCSTRRRASWSGRPRGPSWRGVPIVAPSPLQAMELPDDARRGAGRGARVRRAARRAHRRAAPRPGRLDRASGCARSRSTPTPDARCTRRCARRCGPRSTCCAAPTPRSRCRT